MKIILMAAITLDGKIARNEAHFVDWSSREDKKLFFATSKRAGVIILGNNTYKTLELFRGAQFDLRARLIHVEQMNEAGTVHLRYALG
jgi:dihydrofolate reductase